MPQRLESRISYDGKEVFSVSGVIVESQKNKAHAVVVDRKVEGAVYNPTSGRPEQLNFQYPLGHVTLTDFKVSVHKLANFVQGVAIAENKPYCFEMQTLQE